MAENALLRQQLIILRRQVKRPACTKTDRILLVLLARMVRTWKQALFIVQPQTLLRWHRQGCKLYWKYKSRAAAPKPKISTETVELIQEMARDNRLWGAERIRGELLKLGLRVCKRTIQKYMREVRTARPRGQNWKTFLDGGNNQRDVCVMVSEFLSGIVKNIPPSLTPCAYRSSKNQGIEEGTSQCSRWISYVASTGHMSDHHDL